MSRIGKLPISVPEGVEINISDDNVVTVKGKLGELQQQINKDMAIKVEDGTLTIERPSESKEHKAQHGLSRALLNNMVTGVSEGFTIEQELVGVGYKATANGQVLELALGYSHSIFLELPTEVKVETVTERGKNPTITLKSHDKQLIGQVASKIRSFRKPEPYKGKGILYKGEQIRRKAGKAAAE
ncbi:MAG: 50S ribosomal protein L6 [Bacteroidales bacterium]|jgi:large subunit ribosomal protein L6|nr:50S ribosomal protein L6 [Bacteroidales bacterium]